MVKQISMGMEAIIQSRLPAMADLRHRLHRIPELMYEEHQTAAAIRAELDRLGIQHIDGVAGAPTATLALIGDPAKPCVALRADIDALPITEETGLPYASVHPGKMHACGHDGHMATLVGTAGALSEIAPRLPVCVKLIWQPAEEGGGGADRLVKAGVLDGRIGPKVSAIFALHGWPGLPVGAVATKPGVLLAATDSFSATFIGKGCHAAYPHMGIDPILPAAEAIVNLQQFVTREMDPTDPAVITIGAFHAGTASNVIPDSANFQGTARTISESARKKIQHSIHRRCAALAAAAACQLQFQWDHGYPATVNNPHMTDYVGRIARQVLGNDRFILANRPSMGGEDFAFYLEKIPGCFFLVGVEPPGRKDYPGLHTSKYDFTDAAMAVGMQMFLALVTDFPPRPMGPTTP